MKKIISISLLLTLVLSMSLFTGCGKKEGQNTSEDVYNNESQDNKDEDDSKKDSEKAETDKNTDKKFIVMGTSADFPPFEYIEAGEIVGFDIEISKKIAEKLGMELKIEDMKFGALTAALQTGKIEFIAAGMTRDEEKAKVINFSDSYFKSTQVILVKKDSDVVKSKDDLVGKKIGVQLGTTGELEAKKVEDATVESYDAGYTAVLDLAKGRIDAVVIDQKPAEKFASKNDKIVVLDEELTKEDYSLAVNKNNEELLTTINEVLKEMHENGEYDKLYEKYFGKKVEE
ncbi:MAG: basic amino acid ABC transporter substrate-binding protein [Vallitalea sp.]|jgi:polar amino acid transport system substrate-binding protein|nr:basic amino acid ABC transporter substrate-binding protein [Vallitalea sp.]